MSDTLPEIVCFVGPSGSGKTTLVEKLIPALREHGLRVGVIKNDAHKFQIDKAGKDSDRFFQAGADGVLIQSPTELAFRIAHTDRRDPAELAKLFFNDCDLLLVEGASWSGHPKVEVWNQQTHPERMDPEPAPLKALVTDRPTIAMDTAVPVLDRNDVPAIAQLLSE